MATRSGISRSIRLTRDDPQEVASFLWAATKAEIIEMVGAGIRTTGTVIPSETMAAHSVAMEQTYRTGNGKLGRGKPPLATAAVAVAVSTTTPPAVAPLPISVAAPVIDVSKQKMAEAARLKTLIMSNLLGGGIVS